MQFENCKYNRIELAARFIELAEKFKDYIATHKTVVDFREMGANGYSCGTVACHGGFGAIILKAPISHGCGYTQGARAIANFLGFEKMEHLEDWACDNASVWGRPDGALMFCGAGHLAFGKEEGKTTLTDIASWYLDVASRLLEVEK